MKKSISYICLLLAVIILLAGCSTQKNEEIKNEPSTQSVSSEHQMIIKKGIQIESNKERRIDEFIRLYFAYFQNKNYNKMKEFCTNNFMNYFSEDSVTESYSEELIYISEIGFLPDYNWYYALVGVMTEPTVYNTSYGYGIKKTDD